MRQFGSYLPLVLKGELRGANPSTRGLGWVNLWCTGCYANSSAGKLSWYGRTAEKREILLKTSSRTRFSTRTSIGERCPFREGESHLVLTGRRKKREKKKRESEEERKHSPKRIGRKKREKNAKIQTNKWYFSHVFLGLALVKGCLFLLCF